MDIKKVFLESNYYTQINELHDLSVYNVVQKLIYEEIAQMLGYEKIDDLINSTNPLGFKLMTTFREFALNKWGRDEKGRADTDSRKEGLQFDLEEPNSFHNKELIKPILSDFISFFEMKWPNQLKSDLTMAMRERKERYYK